MNRRTIFNNAAFRTVAALIAGLTAGWLIFGRAPDGGREEKHGHAQADETQVWTCSMHPQIKQNKPGKCPLCAMELIPLRTASQADAVDPDALLLSDEAAALADIRTMTVATGRPVRDIRLYGSIQPNERLVRSQVAHINGRIEKLLVDFTGESVSYGQTIAAVYSPDLQTAQLELLEAVKIKDTQPALLDAAREKLRRWKLSEAQIAAVEESGIVSPVMDVTANTAGIVLTRSVSQGDYVTQGSVLFQVADLSSVWAMFDAYESDLPDLKVGENIAYTVSALPGKTFSGKITFIDPLLDQTTRTAKVRVETANTDGRLKPGMYADAAVRVALRGSGEQVIIPKTAVLWTGKRSIVYVKDSGSFRLRVVELGASLGDEQVVMSGLSAGEEIVVSGAFTVDAASQLEGKPSMMNGEARLQAGVAEEIAVQGLCEMCKERIETAAKSVDGVLSASWEAETRLLSLRFDAAKTSGDEIARAVAAAGHDTETHRSDGATYNALPDCCKYRE